MLREDNKHNDNEPLLPLVSHYVGHNSLKNINKSIQTLEPLN